MHGEDLRCDMLAEIHCGKSIAPEEVANVCAVHMHYANKPHEWKRMHQCKDCYAQTVAIR